MKQPGVILQRLFISTPVREMLLSYNTFPVVCTLATTLDNNILLINL